MGLGIDTKSWSKLLVPKKSPMSVAADTVTPAAPTSKVYLQVAITMDGQRMRVRACVYVCAGVGGKPNEDSGNTKGWIEDACADVCVHVGVWGVCVGGGGGGGGGWWW